MNRINCGLGVVAFLALSGAAFADPADLSSNAFHLTAANGQGTSQFDVSRSQMGPNGTGNGLGYYSDSIQPLMSDAGQLIGEIKLISLNYIHDPVIILNFTVQAGNLPTTFTVTSGLLSFGALNPAVGRASGTLGITDSNGDGAALLAAGGPIYEADYNGFVPTGTIFTTLFGPLAAGAFGSAAIADEFGPGGSFVNIGAPVTNMSSRFSFTLSPFDQAAFTSVYVVLPAPGAAAAIGLLGLATLRRRRA